ncbi:putative hemolysin [Allocatelliglobosispora scoriae]|uniref:Putative hemolysin n=1 Tax=Allocatelliglobosispora scoriae TaxID=643052 RepID=A0A841BSS0_9ACTN|nr:hemolysin family protein [Allocatelliglobosispora scoriae]MBB5870438.1 putative hemolysin [Allocatelliglobosispora scoriae]
MKAAVARAAHVSAAWVSRLLNVDPTVGRERLSEAQLRSLVAANTHLDKDERRIIDDVLHSNHSMVREVMIPRRDVVFLDLAMSGAEAVEIARTESHSRFPVIDGDHDNVIGFVHLRDLVLGDHSVRAQQPPTVAGLVRDVKRLPGTKRVLAALSEMRREGHHLAVVIDEYGGTAGIITLEDLIEELVGEIHDEYDDEPEPASAEGVLPPEVDGRLNLADFADRAGFELPEGPYETLGGYLMAALGRLPAVGDCVHVEDAEVALTVLALDGRRVARVGLHVITPEPTEEERVVEEAEQPAMGGLVLQETLSLPSGVIAPRSAGSVPAVEPAE